MLYKIAGLGVNQDIGTSQDITVFFTTMDSQEKKQSLISFKNVLNEAEIKFNFIKSWVHIFFLW